MPLPIISEDAIADLNHDLDATGEELAYAFASDQPNVAKYIFDLYADEEDEEDREALIAATLSAMSVLNELFVIQDLIEEEEYEAEVEEKMNDFHQFLATIPDPKPLTLIQRISYAASEVADSLRHGFALIFQYSFDA